MPAPVITPDTKPLIDPFGRHVTYLRVSMTDRCDLRCTYCMPQKMKFMPRSELLSFEELERICLAFINAGVKKIRLTGGEPLMRRDALSLIESLGAALTQGAFDELTLTTNGTRLSQFAAALRQAGLRRINISLDTLDPDCFERLTGRRVLKDVLHGIDTALAEGLSVKINVVALRGYNEHEIPSIIEWAHRRGMDVSLIETMPMGRIDENRMDHYLPLRDVRTSLEQQWTLIHSDYRTGGPARYVHVEETNGRLGFITPLTHNFCESCNRVRLTCTGQLYMCLGQNDAADLRAVIRNGGTDEDLAIALEEAMTRKPKGHDFHLDRRSMPAVERQMSVTGG